MVHIYVVCMTVNRKWDSFEEEPRSTVGEEIILLFV